ncbi:hypothetical protein RFI_16265 [Reticulomyxa filosa]|uniref:Uncharacterized protein n=2 Tax=Reticulomyxa filosa TaxID=46433 RepID=X6N5C5_RETFI|nr:hypothetical protein RFI_16265 [Reticulomyxa filosa]|eukprot:ETO20934.1 hypothetical protein RFI_16265 [Reticulomyxa filosa]
MAERSSDKKEKIGFDYPAGHNLRPVDQIKGDVDGEGSKKDNSLPPLEAHEIKATLDEADSLTETEMEDNDIICGSKDIFEIEDYYNASPWEVLISEIEKCLKEWDLMDGKEYCKEELYNKFQNVLSKDIVVGDSYHYILEYHDYSAEVSPLTNPCHFS